ncbi:MAG: ribonuclease J [Bacillota bacterium]|nr:ribonuclease J [Bacillota bacterium]
MKRTQKKKTEKETTKEVTSRTPAASGEKPAQTQGTRGRGARGNRQQAGKTRETGAQAAGSKETPEQTEKARRGRGTRERGSQEPGLRIIPLGGLNEIGKNTTVIEYKNDIMVLDCGLCFPDDEMYGIDIVIPDFTYLIKNRDRVRGMILTHGHEDHIGGIAYLLKELNIPIYGTRLTLGLVENKLKEHGIKGNFNVIKAGQKFKVGDFKVEAIRTTHSIADSLAFAIDTPVGMIFHSGDFKIDYTPLEGDPMDLQRMAELGKKGVLLMLADSTNAERKGYTASEQTVGAALESIFHSRSGRILVATFSSNIYRIQTIIDTAVAVKRKVALSGRSMVNTVGLATELGYLRIPEGVLVDISKIRHMKDNELVIITTGSQGEPMSALTRMASNEHKTVQIKKGDVVILSSNPIPGNERTVSNIVNKLFEKGAEVIYSSIADIHVSGHACEEELKLLHALIKPKFFMPVHGEYRHLYSHAVLAESMGMKADHVFVLKNGQVLQLQKNRAEKLEEDIPSLPVLVDGLGVGDVGNVVLKDRKLLSESGLIIVAAGIDRAAGEVVSRPEILSRGFVYVKENEDLMVSARRVVTESLEACCRNGGGKDWNALKSAVRDSLRSYIYQETGRSPMILPIFLEV